jgi:hypothetical protein
LNGRSLLRAMLATVAIVAATSACASPAPSPAPVSEPPPSRSPVQASPNPNLVAFTTHIREATTREGQLVRDIAAAQQGSADQQRLAARGLTAWAADEQAWLDDNIADSCYEAAWQSWQAGVGDIAKAAAGLASIVDVAVPSAGAGEAAGAQLASGGKALEAAADLAGQARAACR